MLRPSARHFHQSPSSNYDRMNSSVIPGVRSASSAFGMDSGHQSTPNVRRNISQTFSNSMFGEEPDYRSVLEDELGTPNTMQPGLHGGSASQDSQLGMNDLHPMTQMMANIGQQYGLTPSHISEVEKVYKQPNEHARQFAAICFMKSQILAIDQRVSESIISIENNRIKLEQIFESIKSIGNNRTAEGAKWRPNTTVRNFIRDTIKELLIGSSIQAYSTTHTPSNEVIVDSLENVVIDMLIDPESGIEDADLPEDFRSDDPAAEVHVRRLVKEIAKSEKNKYQNLILVHIKAPATGSIVPVLQHLLFQVFRTRPHQRSKRTSNQMWANTSLADKTRLALLRLEGAIYHHEKKDNTAPQTGVTTGHRERSMWNRVDERLAWIATLSPDAQKSFYRWINQFDTKVFTGSQTFEEVKQLHNLKIITPEELKQWILEGEPRLVD